MLHPRVVVFAGHCGTLVDEVRLTESTIRTDFCEAMPSDGGVARDLAYCILSSPADSHFTVVPATGCEFAEVQPGTILTVKGSGLPDFDELEAQVTVRSIGQSIVASASGIGSCGGDSGGPALIDLTTDTSITTRVVGLISRGTSHCGPSDIEITPIAPLVPWLELRTGLDMTPCGSSDGVWDPTPACQARPLPPDSLAIEESEESSVAWSFCGPPVSVPGKIGATAPTVHILAPKTIRGIGDSSILVAEAEASGQGWGVREVELTVEDSTGRSVATVVRSVDPFVIRALVEPGWYKIVARVTDFANNSAEDTMRFQIRVGSEARSACAAASTSPGGSGPAPSLVALVVCFLASLRRTGIRR